MTLQLGSHGPLVSRWTQVPLVDDAYYGLDEAKVRRRAASRRALHAAPGVRYVNDAIPFANEEATAGLVELVGSTTLPDGTPRRPAAGWCGAHIPSVMLKRFRGYALGVNGLSSHDLGELGLAQPVIVSRPGHPGASSHSARAP